MGGGWVRIPLCQYNFLGLSVLIVCLSFNFKNGLAEELPTSKKLEKQDIIIQEIKRKLQITDLDNLASLR